MATGSVACSYFVVFHHIACSAMAYRFIFHGLNGSANRGAPLCAWEEVHDNRFDIGKVYLALQPLGPLLQCAANRRSMILAVKNAACSRSSGTISASYFLNRSGNHSSQEGCRYTWSHMGFDFRVKVKEIRNTPDRTRRAGAGNWWCNSAVTRINSRTGYCAATRVNLRRHPGRGLPADLVG